MDAFDALAISSSVPFYTRATADQMRAVFLTGLYPEVIAPHVERVIVELPVAMLATAAEQLPDAAWPMVIEHLQMLAKHWGAEGRLRQWIIG